MPTVVVLTSRGPDSNYIVHELLKARHFKINGVIVESRQKHYIRLMKKRLLKNSKLSIGIAFRELTSFFVTGIFKVALSRYLANHLVVNAQDKKQKAHKTIFVDSINGIATQNFLGEDPPDFLIVFGTSIIDRKIFSSCNNFAMNIHLGITPEYRGSRSEFWATHNNDLDKIGVTVHEIDQGIDTGRIILQRYLKVTHGESELKLRKRNIELATTMISEIFEQNLTKNSTSVEGRHSAFYSTPSYIDTAKSLISHLLNAKIC